VGGSSRDPATTPRCGGMAGNPCSSDALSLGRERVQAATRCPVGVEGPTPAWGWPE
jgi:hypothetical protein